MWSGLQVKKRDMEVRNGHQNNERRLFHGTSEDTVATINDRGFNRSFAGKNGETFVGIYFDFVRELIIETRWEMGEILPIKIYLD